MHDKILRKSIIAGMANKDTLDGKGMMIRLERLTKRIGSYCEQKEDVSEAHHLVHSLMEWSTPSCDFDKLQEMTQLIHKIVKERKGTTCDLYTTGVEKLYKIVKQT